MGGSKGQSTSTQNQTYTPNAQAAGYITDALGRAQSAANLPFNIPQAPVAGFSQDQQNAFQTINNAQGMAQPYINQAQNYFQQSATPNVSQFFNPLAGAVTSQMNNIFGQQQAQTTGQLTQAAGGVGADRIAVGQANLANQQGLAAGQTLAGLYTPALQAAQQQQNILQGAGYGTAALGAQAQNLTLQGAQAQLGTGGLQQQLSQAQMNAPYQQQLAQAQFPYQQAQFYGSMVGALAPGLGGTTYGQSTSTPAQPSIWSQILGGGLAGAGALGQSGAFGNSGWLTGSSPSYGGGNIFSGDAYGGSSANPLPGLSASDYGPGYARGGAPHPFYADGGDVSDKPIDITAHPFIPESKITPIQPHIPQLQQQPSGGGGGSSGGGFGDILSAGLKLAAMFNRGGSVDSSDMKKFDGHDPFTFFQSRFPKGYADGGAPDDEEPFRMPDAAAVDAWRRGVDADRTEGRTAPDTTDSDVPLPTIITSGAKTRSIAPQVASHVLPFAPETGAAAPATAATAPAPAAAASPMPGATHDRSGFIDSPWAALTAAGLGMMAGTSPFAGVNIGQGGMQGLKMLEQQRENVRKDETVEQSAKRLEQEAKFHEDQYTRMTMGQKLQQEQSNRPYEEMTAAAKATDQRAREQMQFAQKQANRPYDELTAEQKVQQNRPVAMGQRIDPLTGQSVTTYGIRQPDGTYKPVDPTAPAPDPKTAEADDAALPANAKATQGFLIPGKNVPEGVDPSVLASLDPGMANLVRAVDEGRMSLSQVPMKQRFMVERALHAYDGGFDATVWNARNKQQGDLSSNGNAGKLLLATNQLLPHLLTASEKAMEMANSNYPEANTIKNWWLTATGDPRVKEFQTVREVAAMDAARLLRGSGQMAEKDIEEWRKNISESGSPKQLQGVIKMLADDLVGARIDSIKGLYKMNMRQEPPEFLWDTSKAALEKIKANAAAINKPRGAAAPAAAAQPGAPAAAPAAAAPPQVGEIRTNAHGVKGRWNGTGWEVIQ